MDDLIDRQDAIDVVWSVSKAVPTMAIRARQALRELPPAEPEISCSEIPNSSELISRQAAINVIAKWMLEYGGNGEEHGINALKQAAEEIKALPSTEPEERTGNRTGRHACDLISRQAAIDAIFSEPLYKSGMKKRDADVVVPAIYEKIKSLPYVEPGKRGRWIWNPNGMDWNIGAWCCSECGIKAETWWATDKRYPLGCAGMKFCGNCGADMRGGQDG